MTGDPLWIDDDTWDEADIPVRPRRLALKKMTYDPSHLHPRPRRRVCRIATADNEVPVRGEKLDDIWWRGAQWAVTAYGIERLDGCYHIEKEALLDHADFGYWPAHMSRKRSVDIDEFTTCWIVALMLHGFASQVDCAEVRRRFGELRPAHQSDDGGQP